MQVAKLLIDNEWRDASDKATAPVLDPATGSCIGAHAVASEADLDLAAEAAEKAFEPWRKMSGLERGNIMRRAATNLRARVDVIAPLITAENGKTIAESRAEVVWAAEFYDWFAEEARRTYGRVIPSRATGVRQFTVSEPVGPVLCLSPWNWPLVPLSKKLSAALAAGCTIVAKPSEETPLSVVELAKCLVDAGLPKGVLNIVFGDPAKISSRLIAHPAIRKISFTGSVPVGKLLAGQAAAELKPITLELGGHAPVIIFDDADLESAITKITPIKFRTCGQVCSSPTRFIVHESLAEEFAEAMAASAKKLKVGNGMDADTELGPLITKRRQETLDRLVRDAVKSGARLVAGGKTGSGAGFFFDPTVLADVPRSAAIMSEEPFGPVIPITAFRDYEEAVEIANETRLGLAGYAFTRSLSIAQQVSDDLRCGNVGINTLGISLAEAPFGGIGDSGSGREGGIEGIQNYMTTKFVAESR